VLSPPTIGHILRLVVFSNFSSSDSDSESEPEQDSAKSPNKRKRKKKGRQSKSKKKQLKEIKVCEFFLSYTHVNNRNMVCTCMNQLLLSARTRMSSAYIKKVRLHSADRSSRWIYFMYGLSLLYLRLQFESVEGQYSYINVHVMYGFCPFTV